MFQSGIQNTFYRMYIRNGSCQQITELRKYRLFVRSFYRNFVVCFVLYSDNIRGDCLCCNSRSWRLLFKRSACLRSGIRTFGKQLMKEYFTSSTNATECLPLGRSLLSFFLRYKWNCIESFTYVHLNSSDSVKKRKKKLCNSNQCCLGGVARLQD
jgi:hypothetical protein